MAVLLKRRDGRDKAKRKTVLSRSNGTYGEPSLITFKSI
jgi:hypothetical protein